MNGLLTQCGSQQCSLEELLAVEEPPKTDTYTPLNHYDFALNTLTIASDLLKGYQFDGDHYALSNEGKRMFGVMTYRNSSEQHSDVKVALGIRNSYDRSMSAGLVTGSSVIVCDNLMFAGDIKVMRKHTGNSMNQELHDQIVTAIYKSQHQFTKLSDDVKKMKQVPMQRQEKFEYLGILTGEGVLSPTQSSKAYREIWEPSHEEFASESLWSGYNAATEALKSSPPQDVIKRHSTLHELTRRLYLN
ncbi:protein of unknown function (DUF932) [Fodinibius salinus]|uniref:DUF932 domain-containing protein n=1 Tax=Fodinibius salinus TaxID=860790 RepID=A0A5D3YL42_9BACT|nr:DUF932 domain-containing protein [Fodinibius salinus]TYP94865.1 protein of unknown function (DUF932) [Fodinibius salinus]